MKLRLLIYTVASFVLAVFGYGAATGLTAMAWQMAFFGLVAMSMVCLVMDRQKPI
jgi:uncharacterized membrane protein YtjA (UPF0391 family)